MKNEEFVKAIGVSLVISLLAGMTEYLFKLLMVRLCCVIFLNILYVFLI